jgi:acyl carrier protein
VDRVEVAGRKRLREDWGLEPLCLIDLAVAAEDAFGIRIPDDNRKFSRTIGDALRYIRQARFHRLMRREPSHGPGRDGLPMTGQDMRTRGSRATPHPGYESKTRAYEAQEADHTAPLRPPGSVAPIGSPLIQTG